MIMSSKSISFHVTYDRSTCLWTPTVEMSAPIMLSKKASEVLHNPSKRVRFFKAHPTSSGDISSCAAENRMKGDLPQLRRQPPTQTFDF